MWLCSCQLYVLDTNPQSLSAQGWLEDVSKVQKYVMSDEEYGKREGTYRAYQHHMRKVGQHHFRSPIEGRKRCAPNPQPLWGGPGGWGGGRGGRGGVKRYGQIERDFLSMQQLLQTLH